MNLDAANMSPLADIKGVRLLTRKSDDAIYKMSDGGDLVEGSYQWVWNVATDARGTIPDLRWWIGEVIAAKRQADLTLAQVINFILPPHRREFPAGEVRSLLLVSRPTLMELRAELLGDLRDGGSFYPRPGLVKFFTTRWLGVNALRGTDVAASTVASQASTREKTERASALNSTALRSAPSFPNSHLPTPNPKTVPASPATPKQNRNGFNLPATKSPIVAGKFQKGATC